MEFKVYHCFVVLMMMVTLAVTSVSPPITFQRFTGSFQYTVSIDIGPPLLEVQREEALKNVVTAAGLPPAVLSLAKKAEQSRNIESGDFLSWDVGVSGTITIDTTNNIVFQYVGILTFTARGGPEVVNFSIPLNTSSLLYYDLNKNYTWGDSGCTCEPISGTSEMMITYVPPFAQFVTNTTIFINGKPVEVEQWGAKFPLFFTNPLSPLLNSSVADISWLFYANPGQQQVNRVQFKFSMLGVNVNATLDVWNIVSLNSNSVVLPNSKCAQACKAAVNVVSDYAKCLNVTDRCQCLTGQNFSLPFCGNVNWLFSKTIFPNVTDQYVAQIYQEIQLAMKQAGTVTAQCLDDLKNFLCKFYFSLCGSNSFNGDFQKPPLSMFACNATSLVVDDDNNARVKNAAYQSTPFSAYMTALGKTLPSPSPPITFQRFSSSFQHTVVVDIHPILSKEQKEEGLRRALAAAGLPQKMLSMAKRGDLSRNTENDLETWYFGISGTITVDTTNNIVLQTAQSLNFAAKFGPVVGFNVSIPVNETILLYYDLNKNYTWTETGCNCSTISGTSQMFLTFVPPFGVYKSNTTIFVNGQPIPVEQWSFNFPLGFANPVYNNNSLLDISWSLYANTAQGAVNRVQFTFNIPGVTVNSTLDMWNVVGLNSNSAVLPAPQCANVCKAVVNTVSEYGKCLNATDRCQCLTGQNTSVPFCGNVNWLFSNTIFPNITDQYAAQVFQEIQQAMFQAGAVTAQCLVELKTFLCKFYFSLCGSNGFNGDFQKPPLSVFSCNGTSLSRMVGDDSNDARVRNAAYQSAPFSAYMAAEGKTQVLTPNNNGGSSGLEGWQIALIVIGSVVGGVVLVAGVAIYLKKRRGPYAEL